MLTQHAVWGKLKTHQETIAKTSLSLLFKNDPERFSHFSLSHNNILLDYSKNWITSETMSLLCELAHTQEIDRKIQTLLNGKSVNTTENRSALHTALRNRSNQPILVNGKDVIPQINETLKKMGHFSNAIRNKEWRGFTDKPITDIVNIGIGGSDLGPLLVVDALSAFATKNLRFHFISTLDAHTSEKIFSALSPETTLFIISSKSFSTLETQLNAEKAKKWFIEKTGRQSIEKHFVAVTSHPEKATAFGLPADHIFSLWEWVGGRYSVWSAIGLPVALSIGMDRFIEFLDGAHGMDKHFQDTAYAENMPVLLSLLSIWYINFFGAQTQALLPYDDALKHLPAYEQQVHMESLGKQTGKDNKLVNYDTGQIIFGTTGNHAQHSFLQLLHQGTKLIPVDFILSADNEPHLIANCLSQSKILMDGKTAQHSYQILPGNHPSNTLFLSQLTPSSLGSLLALYEHKVFVQSALWDINAFDQWGVEAGKKLATELLPSVAGEKTTCYDSSTNGLIDYFKKNQG